MYLIDTVVLSTPASALALTSDRPSTA